MDIDVKCDKCGSLGYLRKEKNMPCLLGKCNGTMKPLKEKTEPVAKSPAAMACYAPFKPPFKYDCMGQCIFDDEGQLISDMRGWGYLTGTGGGLGYDSEKAANIQDKIGERIAQIMTEDAGA